MARSRTGVFCASEVDRNARVISGPDRARIASSAQSALGLIRGKWKIAILVQMIDHRVRLGQLRRLIPRASKKVLVQQLHELENDGIIVRTDLSGKIKHVEYTISAPLGVAVINLVGFLSDWGIRHARMAQQDGTPIIAKLPVDKAPGTTTTVRKDAQPCASSDAASRARPLVSMR